MKMRKVFLIVFPVFVFAVLAVVCPRETLAAQLENGVKSQIMMADTSEPAPKAEPAGNETCPVTGEKIDPKGSVTYEYKGKVYNFCCQDCVEQFKKDPEKYIEKMEKEKAGTGGAEKPR